MRTQRHCAGMRRYASMLAAALLAAYLAWSGAAVRAVSTTVDRPGGEPRVAGPDASQGLSSVEWRSIEELVREAEYQITWHAATTGAPVAYYRAPNRAQGWEVLFRDGGVEVTPATAEAGWRWGFALAGYGYQGSTRLASGPPDIGVDACRLAYGWDGNLSEWYDNTAQGLEHGFTLAERPAGFRGQALQIDLAILGTLRPQLVAGEAAVEFRDEHDAAILRYDRLLVTDASGLALPADLTLVPADPSLRSADPALRITIDDAGALYPITVDPLLTSQVAKLTAGDGAALDRFGHSVSISGDTIVVAAYGDDSDRGSAYVLTRNEGGADGWGEVCKLSATDGAAADRFAYSVSISGDMVVVGADKDDDGGADSGSAYLFERNEGGADNWGQVLKLTAGDGAANDHFGYSVSICNDTLVVGAYQDDSQRGSAYVFARNQGEADGWGEVAKLTASDGAAYDWFGYSVSLSGDTAVVGAIADDDNGSSSGSAYLFERNGGGADNWGQVRKLVASDGAANDYFGYSVSIDNDTVIVGAQRDDSFRGSAYLFERNQGGAEAWGQVQKLVAGDGESPDMFGSSVAISGDTVAVGAYGDDSSTGSAYLFERNEGGADAWGQVARLAAADGATEDRFGSSVSISGDTVVAGAYGDDDHGDTSGAAYVFCRSGGAWLQQAHPTGADGAAHDQFGCSAAVSGDTVVVGAYEQGTYRGAAYVFTRNHDPGAPGTPLADNWGQVRKLTAAGGEANDQFGASVAIDGDTAVVGAPGAYDGWLAGAGLAYVFERNWGGADNWGQMAVLTGTTELERYGLGSAIAISGDTVVVGAKGDSTYRGNAYVFERNWGGADHWGLVKKIQNPHLGSLEYFGHSVSISGDTIAVGAYGYDSAAGRVYVFARNYHPAFPGTPMADYWGRLATVTASDHAAGDRFGWSVSLSGDTLIAGAQRDEVGGNTYQGSAYVFERNTGGADAWGQVAKLTAPGGAPYDYFGSAASISGDRLVVGANGAAGNAGAAYVFERNAGGADNWGMVQSLSASGLAAGDHFGWSASIGEEALVVGAPFDTVGGDESHGSAYIFQRKARPTIYLPLVLR